MQQPCLPIPRRRKRIDDDPIEQPISNFDSIETMDAMEYMAAVMQEASAMPDMFISTVAAPEPTNGRDDYVPIEGSAASLHYLVSHRTSVFPPPTHGHGPPSRQWVDGTLANFSEIRSYLEQCDRVGIGGKETDRIAFPPMRDGCGWHEFCVGADDVRGNADSYFDDGDNSESEEGDGNSEGSEEPEWCRNIPATGHAPEVRLILQMDQVMTRRVLAHLTDFITDGWSPCSKQRSAWMYALLARLERPLHRDDAATLFGLLKHLTKVRANTHVERREDLARLNMLIVIVGLYFEQGGGYANIMEPI